MIQISLNFLTAYPKMKTVK